MVKVESYNRSYCHTHTKHKTKVKFQYWIGCSLDMVGELHPKLWGAYNKLAFQQNQSWATTLGVFLDRHWILFWDYNLFWGGTLWTAQRWCHFRNLPLDSGFTRLFPAEERKWWWSEEHPWCSLIYLFVCRESTGNSFRNWQQKTSPSLSQSLTLAELPAPSDPLFTALVAVILWSGVWFAIASFCLCQATTSLSVAFIVRCHWNMGLMALGPLSHCSQHQSLLWILLVASSMGLSTCT